MVDGHKAEQAGIRDASLVTQRHADLYDEVAHETARMIIHRYSTSFGLASRLLAQPVRGEVENIYALVRVADEIVDGVAATAGQSPAEIRRMLDEFETETERAMAEGYSTNLVIHAFAQTARRAEIGTDLTRPFFASMRADITEDRHNEQSFADYVYGSAEVVGLMCLQTFLVGVPVTDAQKQEFVAGARALGAAFQKVNFLRDLSADVDALGRSYFPGVDVATLDDATKMRLVADIDADLAVSAAIVPKLPRSSRKAVSLAQSLFAELNLRIERTPAAVLKTTRVSVPTARKATLWLAASMGKTP